MIACKLAQNQPMDLPKPSMRGHSMALTHSKHLWNNLSLPWPPWLPLIANMFFSIAFHRDLGAGIIWRDTRVDLGFLGGAHSKHGNGNPFPYQHNFVRVNSRQKVSTPPSLGVAPHQGNREVETLHCNVPKCWASWRGKRQGQICNLLSWKSKNRSEEWPGAIHPSF